MITFDQVSKRYGERLALDSLSWQMNEGECVVFLGHSAAGKTTLLRLITHETQPTSGRVTVGTFRGGRLTRGQRALLRRTLGIIYEDFRLLGDRTVFENIALAVRIAGHSRDDEVIPRVMYALEQVGLQLKQAAFPHELSAGERQRAAIARAIVNRPAVILADEPTGALEQRSADDVLALLRRIHGEGAALLVVTTRREVANGLPGRVLEIEDGHLAHAPSGPGPETEGGLPAGEFAPPGAESGISGASPPPDAAAPPTEAGA
ncbi:MAG: ATP-binding cassette domain-containing protein [Candidatus Eisenbacteria bacterium]|nr:ATP-binding cassette domain-containing protein [Candidatus Eisenbacteria bacterium]